MHFTGWTAIVKTGDENNSGTDSSLHIDIFGTEGYMEWSTLHGSFERYDTDTTYFDISIGEPYKMYTHLS